MAITFHTLDTFDTELSADSVEWCPVKPFQALLVCGTYELIDEVNDDDSVKDAHVSSRLGSIHMFSIIDGGKLKVLQKIDCPAVLDMKWMHCVDKENRILLAVANSSGKLQVYELVKETVTLKLIDEKRICDRFDTSEILVLSLSWYTEGNFPNNCASGDPKILVSDDQGCISLFKLHNNNLWRSFTWKAHIYEAWIVAFDCEDTNRFYSGGDDRKFKTFDIRVGSTPVTCISAHESGLTSIHCCAKPQGNYILATGGYDEILKLWDPRNLKQPTSEINLKGGVWRLKWHFSSHCFHILAACMRNGVKIIDCEKTNLPKIIGEYNEHKDILYGCDWSHLGEEDDIPALNIHNVDGLPVRGLVASCSFYDHTLNISAISMEDKD